MTIYLATKTLAAIEKALDEDQGASFRRHLGQTIHDVTDAYDDKPPGFRSHFGVSTSGEPCARKLWYNWHWVKLGRFPARIVRLFNRGHLEEARFVALLRMIGIELFQADDQGKQYRVSMFGGHYGSAIDGVALGIPDLPDLNMPCLAEFKTHNNKSFVKLQKEGLFKSKQTHYIQMVQYMGYYKLKVGLYLAVNKDTDELYAELIEYDQRWDDNYRQRSYNIIFAKRAPERISESPSTFDCTYCDHKMLCHYGKDPGITRNCRTCPNGQAVEDGTWVCAETGEILDKEKQLVGCDYWQKHPDL